MQLGRVTSGKSKKGGFGIFRTKKGKFMIHLGEAARHLRERLGYSQREAGKALGISYPHLNAIENGKASPTAGMIERYYTAWGVDLYMMAVVMFGDGSRVNWIMKETIDELRVDWEAQIEQRISEKGKRDVE